MAQSTDFNWTTQVLDSEAMAATALGGLDPSLTTSAALIDATIAMTDLISTSTTAPDLTDISTVTTLLKLAIAQDPAIANESSSLNLTPVAQVIAANNQAVSSATNSIWQSLTGNTTTDGDVTACFCPGTMILTPGGERPVEELRIGDLVTTQDGSSKPIRWIGRRSYSESFAAGKRRVLPVCIRAGALADGIPRRDLWLSPEHSILFDDAQQGSVLVPAGSLINGCSIIQPNVATRVEYLHIELDQHDVIQAEGTAAETFVDDASRMMFENAREYYDLYGRGSMGPAQFCVARVDSGPRVDAIWLDIAARGSPAVEFGHLREVHGFVDDVILSDDSWEVQGWAQHTGAPEVPVCVEVLVGDRVIAQGLANRYRADLRDIGLGTGRHAFQVRLDRHFSPADRRQLSVRRSIDRAKLPRSNRFHLAEAS